MQPGDADPLTLLGLSAGADADTIRAARRSLARSAHPDQGGTLDAMQAVNEAADRALRDLAVGRGRDVSGRTPAPPKRHREQMWRGGRRDHPSFTIEALPVVAFEALQIVARWHGEVIDDDPPYHLTLKLAEPYVAWCQLDIVPDAGASTVSLTVGRVEATAHPGVTQVRDTLIASLNRLDWAELDPNQQPPS